MQLRQFLFSIAVGLSGMLAAQDPMEQSQLHAIPLGGYGTQINTWASYSAGSDMLTNAFVNKMYLGGYVDASLKDDVMKRRNDRNVLGATADIGLSTTLRFRKNKPESERGIVVIEPKNYIRVAVRDRYRADAAFGGDVFELAFYGNRPFRDRTADLSNIHFQFLHWQQVQVTIPLSNKTFVGLSFLKGQSLLQANTKRAQLFTENNGYFLDVDADFTFRQSDTATTGFGAMNGVGASLDFTHTFVFGVDKNYVLRLSANDIGAMWWNGKTQTYSKDTSFRYTGFTIDDLTVLNDSSFAGLATDSLLPHAVTEKVMTMMPGAVHASFWIYSQSKWSGLVRASFYPFSQARPELRLTAIWRPNPMFQLNSSLAVGGYARLRIPIDAQFNIHNHFLARVGTDNVMAYALPKMSGGQGLFIALGYRF